MVQRRKEVVASDRIEIIERGCIRKIVINDVTAADEGMSTPSSLFQVRID